MNRKDHESVKVPCKDRSLRMEVRLRERFPNQGQDFHRQRPQRGSLSVEKFIGTEM